MNLIAKKGLCMLKFNDINVCYLSNKVCVVYVWGHLLGLRAVWLLTDIT